MQLGGYDRAIILTCRGNESRARRTADLLASKGLVAEAVVNGVEDGPTPPVAWLGLPAEYPHFLALRSEVRRALDDRLGKLLVVEDDLDLAPDFDRVVGSAEIPPDWSLLYYGANHTWHPTEEVGRHVLKLHGSFCLHCLGIDRSAFGPILELPEVGPADWAIGIYLHHRLSAYALWPSVALQLPGRSSMTGAIADYSEQFRSKGKNWRD